MGAAGAGSGVRSRWRAAAALLATLLMLAGCGDRTVPPSVQVLREAQVEAGAGAGRSVALPMQVHGGLGDSDGSVRLLLRFDRPAGLTADTLLAAHAPSRCGATEARLNGHVIDRDSAYAKGETAVCPQPMLVVLPTLALRDRDNLLELHLRGPVRERVTNPRRATGLSEVWIGPEPVLARAYEESRYWPVQTLRVAQVVMVTLGGFILLLAASSRRARYTLWYGLTVLLFGALLWPAWWNSVPVSYAVCELLMFSLPAPALACGVAFLAALASRPLSRRMALLLAAQCVAVPLTLVLLPADRTHAAALAWTSLLGAEGLVSVGAHLRRRWAEGQRAAWPTIAIGLAAVGVWAIDIAQRPGGPGAPGALVWAITSLHGWAALLIGMGLRLLYLFGQSLVDAEASRVSLESQVRRITAEIEHNFAQLAELRVEQITEQERKRIASDLHDDLGAKLLTIVHTCDNERIAELGREALDEMRLSVRGLSGRPMRLGDAMADWRAETVQRLGQTNIQVDWHSPAEDIDHILPARAFVQTTRILREAVNNIIKHSGASMCEVTCYAGQGEYGLVVEDNGRGIPADFGGGIDRGHGLASMKHRAKQLNGQCLIESGVGLGTVVRLTLPL
jgi:signal transduction histidine kinase